MYKWLRTIALQAAPASGGFGMPWGHARSFASRLSASDDAGQGFNWQVAQWPYLARIADADGDLTGVVVMGQATSNLWFDLVDGQYVARFSATETLVYYPDELVYRLTDLSGNVTEFGSFDIIRREVRHQKGSQTSIL